MKKTIFAIFLAATISISSFNVSFAGDIKKVSANPINIQTLTKNESNNKEVKVSEFARLFVLSSTYEHGEDAFYNLTKNGYVTKDDNLNESSSIKNGQAVKILLRALKTPDVTDKNYFDKAKEIGLTNGYLDGELSENDILNIRFAKQIITNYNDIVEKSLSNKAVEQYPVSDFFKRPDSLAYYLTKDGKTLVYIKPWENRFNIFTKDIETGVEKQITKIKDRDMVNYFVKDNTILYMKDLNGDENYHLFKADEEGNEIDLTPFEGTRAVPLDFLTTSDVKDEILIQMNKDNKEVFSVYKLNVVTGNIEKVIDNTMGYTGFMTDNDGKVRVATFTDGVNSGYLYRETEAEEFKVVKTYDFHESAGIIMFGEDNKTGYALSNVGRDTTALVKFDIPTGKELGVIYQNDKVDITGVVPGNKKGTLGALAYTTDKMHYVFFDKEYEQLYNDAKSALKTNDTVGLPSMSQGLKTTIISVSSDVNKGMTYLFDNEKKSLVKLTDTNTTDPTKMSEMKPISYKSRDGMTIHGYLTIPKNKQAKNLPVIINPHGGPWARDYFGFNQEVQFLANRGYAVLQINFRGSTGYGKAFLEASYKQWGQNMQNDITDGVNWLIDTGVANPDKVGIYGGSYGGYATLAGVTFTPDLYAAAVDYVGVSNLTTFLETMPPYWESMKSMMYEMVGDPIKDKEMLEKYSPSLHADKIKTPLFIAQGANDPRVKKSESDQMVEALKKNGVDVDYMVKDDEGHGFAKFENQIEFYTAMEKFFSEYLK